MKNFGVLGFPLKHTMSPPIHKRLFALSGISDFNYDILEISPDDLDKKSSELLEMEGFNVTIPYKIEIIKYLDELHPSAERYSSVNCVLKQGNKHIGYNTDCDGFLHTVNSLGENILSGNILQCGCGGVGRMAAIETVRSGGNLTLSLLEGFENTADPVKEYAGSHNCKGKITIVHPDEIKGNFDLIINASPVGMFPKVDACPVTEEVVCSCRNVFDIVYNPEITKLIGTAKKHGIKAVGGMSMLVWQAVYAHKYWYNGSFDENDINKLISDMHALLLK